MQVQWRALSLAVNKPLKAFIPTGTPLAGEAAAELEMPAGNHSPATEPQCWRDEGKAAALHEECNSSNSKRQEQPPITAMPTEGSALRAFFLLSYTSKGKKRGMGTTPRVS